MLPALQHRQVSEAARILQGALVGARDSAIKNNRPSGIRLLPDPVLNGINPSTNLLDATQPLAYNRVIPIAAAPDYSEGMLVLNYGTGNLNWTTTPGLPYPYALMVYESVIPENSAIPNCADVLVLEHPARRQDSDQQHGRLVYRRGADGHSRCRSDG